MAFMIINVSIQTFLITEGFKGLDCVLLDENKSFLIIDLTTECYTKEYYYLVIFLIFVNLYYILKGLRTFFPLLIMWCGLFPLINLLILIGKYRSKLLDDFKTHLYFGYFLNGYKTKYFYWFPF